MLVTIDQAAYLLRQNKVVIFPTETVYGIGANALSDEACRKIYNIKQRPLDNPLIVHVSDTATMNNYAYLSETALKIVSVFSPGPLTIIAKRKRHEQTVRDENDAHRGIADTPCCYLDTIALRIPSHPVAQALLKSAALPIAAPSANISGRLSATTYAMAEHSFAHVALPMLDGGDCEIGIESTILSFVDAVPIIVRTGRISAEDIAKKTQVQVVVKNRATGTPGSGYTHYKPETDLYVYGHLESIQNRLQENSGIVIFTSDRKRMNQIKLPATCKLIQVDSDVEYSKRFYHILYEFRTMSCIFAPFIHHKRYGIQDRLMRAAKEKID